MPTIYRWKGYRFFFFSNEGSPPEPPHVHIRHGERRAKFWLVPEVALANAWRMNASELSDLEKIVQDKREDFERAWHEHLK
ncbi:MAG: DUF4160 domain-containing protein [Phycisphaerae bacterium]|nr:DUF4160 domain-containing protein [Phycisphaerae bacterium]